MRPKNKSDVVSIYKTKGVNKRKFADVEFDCDKDYIPAPEDWDPKKKSLVIVGHSNMGKSNWCRNYFEKCYEITETDCLKDMPDDATGLLFDDQEYANLKISTQKSLTDCRTGRAIKARNVNGWKPHLPAIFTCNSLFTCLDMSDEAIKTRCYVWDVTSIQRMYMH